MVRVNDGMCNKDTQSWIQFLLLVECHELHNTNYGRCDQYLGGLDPMEKYSILVIVDVVNTLRFRSHDSHGKFERLDHYIFKNI